MAEKRVDLQKECAGKPVTAVSKLGAERWQALGEAEKAVYQKQYEEAKAKYEEDMKAFLEAGGEKKGAKKNGKADGPAKRKKDAEAPKRPAGGAFGCFLEKNREAFTKEVAGQPVTAITKLASAKWKALSEPPKSEEAQEVEPPTKKQRASKDDKEPKAKKAQKEVEADATAEEKAEG